MKNHQESQSYDVCFLRCGVQQTEFFCHFGHEVKYRRIRNAGTPNPER